MLLITKQHPGQYFVSLPYFPITTEKQDLPDVTYFCSKVHHRRQASGSRRLALSRLSPTYPCLRKESEINMNQSLPQKKGTNHYYSRMEREGERFTLRGLQQECLQSHSRETLALASKLLALITQSCPTLCNPMDYSPPDFSPGKNAGVGCHSLLQGIFPIQRSNPGLLHWQAVSLPLSHLGSLQGCLLFQHVFCSENLDQWGRKEIHGEQSPHMAKIRVLPKDVKFMLRPEQWVRGSGLGQGERRGIQVDEAHVQGPVPEKYRVFKEVAAWLQHPEQDKSGQADMDPPCRALSGHSKDLVP